MGKVSKEGKQRVVQTLIQKGRKMLHLSVSLRWRILKPSQDQKTKIARMVGKSLLKNKPLNNGDGGKHGGGDRTCAVASAVFPSITIIQFCLAPALLFL